MRLVFTVTGVAMAAYGVTRIIRCLDANDGLSDALCDGVIGLIAVCSAVLTMTMVLNSN